MAKRSTRIDLAATRLREVLDYDPATGSFTWRDDKLRHQGGNTYKGTLAGTLDKGYRRIQVDGVIYKAARLAVLWMTDKFPAYDVDHINLNRADDSWLNLREATHSQNQANKHSERRKHVPFKGVYWNKQKHKYYARIGVNSRSLFLGSFDDAEDAHAAYIDAARKYFGKFARSD